MTPEAADYLAKAWDDLEDARKILGIDLTSIAARSAYYAAFHAAEALVFERSGKIAKTHAGVHSEFARLIKHRPPEDRASLTFLAQSYRFKQLSDYGTGRTTIINRDEAAKAISDAQAFVERVVRWIEGE